MIRLLPFSDFYIVLGYNKYIKVTEPFVAKNLVQNGVNGSLLGQNQDF